MMSEYWDDTYDWEGEAERPPDPAQIRARAVLERYFEQNNERVFYSRQIEICHEDEFFHWITNRAIRELIETGLIRSEKRELRTRTRIKLLWHRAYRYYKRDAVKVVNLVEEFADPAFSEALGYYGEMLVQDGFVRNQFIMQGRNVKQFRNSSWTKTNHDLDFIFERDGLLYGVEVKNKLGYMDQDEFRTKIELCKHLGIIPVFVVRMLPVTWLNELIQKGGFALILKYQLYPFTHKELAERVASELGLPVGAPRVLEDGTMQRFLKWHQKAIAQKG